MLLLHLLRSLLGLLRLWLALWLWLRLLMLQRLRRRKLDGVAEKGKGGPERRCECSAWGG